ncbi:MAG: hypothetical protein WAM14_10170 [Candidatus Nitrosopolaris sp.]
MPSSYNPAIDEEINNEETYAHIMIKLTPNTTSVGSFIYASA